MNKRIVLVRLLIVNGAVLLSLLLGEGLLRCVPSINDRRVAFNQFKSQVFWLDDTTRLFKKNIYHEFEEAYRPEGEKYFSRAQPRLFRTDDSGYILGSPSDFNGLAEYRVLFSGGSVVECQEVDEPFRFPAVVQSLLNERGLSEFRAWNLGIRGHTTFETLKLMAGTKLYDGFQAILFMHNINDWNVLANCGTYFSSQREGATEQHESMGTQLRKMVESLRDTLVSQSNCASLLHSIYQNHFSPGIVPQEDGPHAIDPETVQHIRDQYRSNIISLAAVSSAKNAEAVFLTQPSGLTEELQEALNDELRQVCQDNHYHLIDVAARFPAEPDDLFFPDGVHLNNEGSLLVGTIVAEELPHILEATLDRLPIRKEWLRAFHDMLNRGPTQNVAIPNARYPVMSPDMKRLYFQTSCGGKRQVCSIDIGEGMMERLSPLGMEFWHPCPADNGCVYAVSDCLHGEAIFALEKQGIRLLLPFDDNDLQGAIPARSRDGTMCFPGTRAGRAPDLFLYSPHSNTLRQITHTDCEEWRPVFHPDGRRIFYISNQRGTFDVYCYDMQEDKSSFVIGTEGDDWDVDVSPDGNRLVFASRKEGNFDLMLLDIVSGKLQQLTCGTGNEWDPRFTPNGTLIMYAEEISNSSHIRFIKVPP